MVRRLLGPHDTLPCVLIVKVKYPRELYDVIWLFDHSSGHTAIADDALNVNRMNVCSGGAHPKMRGTIYVEG